jgi:hypothetical protein
MTGTKEDWNKGEAMGGLIWIIVMIVVIKEIRKLQGKSGQRVKPNVPRQQQNVRPNQMAGQQNVRPNQIPWQQNARPDQMTRQQSVRPNQMAGQQSMRPNQMAGRQNVRPNQTMGQQNVRPDQMAGRQTQSAGGAAMAGYRRPQPKQAEKDILKRAAENVNENDVDELEQQMMAGAHELVNAIDIDSTSELMHEVEDLMIMGYQANLPFERDFIAEGVAMLNGYELDMGA